MVLGVAQEEMGEGGAEGGGARGEMTKGESIERKGGYMRGVATYCA